MDRRIDLVYGGGSLGLMGLVSQAVHDGGRHVLGLVSLSHSLSLIKEVCIIFSLYNSYLPLWCIGMGLRRHSFAYLFITASLFLLSHADFLCIGIPISRTYSKPDIMGSNAGRNLTAFESKSCVSNTLICGH